MREITIRNPTLCVKLLNAVTNNFTGLQRSDRLRTWGDLYAKKFVETLIILCCTGVRS